MSPGPTRAARAGRSRASDLLRVEGSRVDQALREVTRRGLSTMVTALREPVEYALSTTGKRLRPILCVEAYRASRPDAEVPPELYRLSCALEIVHTYSLVHDDLPCMDDDDLRRGRPTVHRVYGTARAILAGAALLPMAMEVLDVEGEALGLSREGSALLISDLAQAAGALGMVGGQLMDLQAEQRPVAAAALERIHRAKTGALLTSALRIGGIAGRADHGLLDALTRFGSALGLAFQIADDLLDVEGDPADIGKTAGRDLALRKASYPALFGVERARSLARERADEAKDALAGFELLDLEALADYVVERRK